MKPKHSSTARIEPRTVMRKHMNMRSKAEPNTAKQELSSVKSEQITANIEPQTVIRYHINMRSKAKLPLIKNVNMLEI